jgi:hypothetical protein
MRRPIELLTLAGCLLAAPAGAQPAEPDRAAPAHPPAGQPAADEEPTPDEEPAPDEEPSAAGQPAEHEPAGEGQPADDEPPTAPGPPTAPERSGAPPPSAHGKAPRSGAPTGPPAPAKPAGEPAEPAEPTEQEEPAALELPGHWVARHVFPEERYPAGDPDDPWAVDFAMHGYFRAPLRLAIKARENPAEGDADSDVRSPWLVDDDYFRSGFSYTPVNEQDFAEIYFMAGNEHVTGNVALMASLFSDSARVMLDQQLGIAQAWVGLHEDIDLDPVTLRLRAKGGGFWDRFGWLPKYDTYIFGRTHQIGGQVDAEVDFWRMTFGFTQGFGAHLEAIEANQGFSPLIYSRFHAAYDRIAEIGLYYLSTWSHDQRQLSEMRDGSMEIFGADARVDSGWAGKAYFAVSALSAERASFLSPSIEVMHSNGGRGITENFLGTASSNDGTGDMWNIGFEYDYSVQDTLKMLASRPRFPLGGDVVLSAFLLYAFVNSDQVSDDPMVNRDNRGYFKHGYELAWWVVPWAGLSARYDRVVPDMEDEPSSFRIISPRVSLRGRLFGAEALIFYQLSHYDYSERVGLRAGQVPNETLPDDDVHKIQAEMTF